MVFLFNSSYERPLSREIGFIDSFLYAFLFVSLNYDILFFLGISESYLKRNNAVTYFAVAYFDS